jgi:thiamine biosynthesis protein ThiS
MVINGKNISLKEDVSLKCYLNSMSYDLSRIAVEKNGVIIPKSSFESEILRDNDTLEIVYFVGGG